MPIHIVIDIKEMANKELAFKVNAMPTSPSNLEAAVAGELITTLELKVANLTKIHKGRAVIVTKAAND